MKSLDIARQVLSDNETVRFGIFGQIAESGYFPPHPFLNEFFLIGHDPCDQDQRMQAWTPFELDFNEYGAVQKWWLSGHPGTIESSLGVHCWSDWISEIIESA